MKKYNMKLNLEEKEILEGKQGKVKQKILESVVFYGEASEPKILYKEGCRYRLSTYIASLYIIFSVFLYGIMKKSWRYKCN